MRHSRGVAEVTRRWSMGARHLFVAAERSLLALLDDAKPCLREIRRNYNLADGPVLRHLRILLARTAAGAALVGRAYTSLTT